MGHVFAAMLPLSAQILAQAGAAPAAGSSGFSASDGLMQALPLAAMFAVIYFLLIRPSQTQRTQQLQLLAALKKDDDVVTQGGILGRITALDDKIVTLEISDKVRIRVLRERITGLYGKKD